MKRKKSLLALLLTALLLVSLLAACAQAEEGTSSTNNTTSDTTNNSTTNDSTPNTANDPDTTVDEEDIDEIKLYFYDLYSHGDNGQKIIDAANAIVEPLINVHVDIEWFDMGSFSTQLGLNIANGTPVDLVCLTPIASAFSQLYANNQLMEIGDLLVENAPQAYEMMEPYLNAMSFDGGIYGLPTLKNWADNQYIMMRADILRELDLYDYAANMTTWAEYEEILRQVTEAMQGTGIYGLGRARTNSVVNNLMALGYENFFDFELYDSCGDTSLGLLASDKNGNIYSYYENEATIDGMKRLASWYEKGYIWPDSAFSETDGDVLVSSNVIFSKMEGGELGVEVRQLANCGTEMLCVKTANGYISTSQLTSWGIAIPITSEQPEAACRFIDQLYTNAELLNLLLMGIEGEDYVVLDSGEIDYPEGLDSNTVEYHEPDWLFGNQFMVLPWAGNGANYREIAAQENANSAISPYLGFSLDVSALDNVIASLSAVKDQYVNSLSCGLYTEDLYQEFITKLYAQGLQDYIDAVQSQLSAFLAAQ